MNMSSMECKDIEHALVSSDWDKIYAYMKKKLEKQGEKPQGKTALEAIKEEKVDNQNCAKHTDKVEPKFKVGDNIIKKHNSDINKFGIFTITDIKNGKYMYNNSIICDISEQNEWELVEKVDFKIGDWITLYGDGPFKILKIEAEQNGILDYLLLVQNGRDTYYNKKYVDENARLWTIQDAKDGDVLAATMCSGRVWIGIFKEYNGSTFSSYCFMNTEGIFHLSTSNHGRGEAIHPATKEQRDLLFQKMREAGYEWDAKKKELKKIEQKLNDKVEPFDEYEGLTDFERTLADICIGWIGKEPSWKEYIKDNADVLLKIAIEKFNSIQDVAFEQKSAWSEVDENFFVNVCSIIDTDRIFMESAKRRCKNWLKSIKERVGCEVNCTTKKEWSEEDKRKIDRIYSILMQAADTNAFSTTCRLIGDKECVELQDFLKSLRPQNRWKPSDEQMEALRKASKNEYLTAEQYDILVSLYNDLQKKL